jgi:peptidyl-prolyl cis-trans isomerase B (cyclophilin B)
VRCGGLDATGAGREDLRTRHGSPTLLATGHRARTAATKTVAAATAQRHTDGTATPGRQHRDGNTGTATTAQRHGTATTTEQRQRHRQQRVNDGDGEVVTKEQRRRQLAREKYERQQRRRQEQRRKARVRNSVIAAVVVAAVAGVGAAAAAGAFTSDSKKKSSDNAAASPSASANPSASASASPAARKGPDPCAKPAKGSPGKQTWSSAPALSVDKSATYTFTLQTTCGTIPLKLDAAKAPQTVSSFAFLASKGFFDHTKCHRLTTNGIYVLQCGDPNGDGSGGPGYTIPDENLSAFGKASSTDGKVVYPAGTVAMANKGSAHTGGSQFFLVYKDSRLAPSYTPFGTIGADGMKVLSKIAAAGNNGSSGPGDGAPNATVTIDKATVTKS